MKKRYLLTISALALIGCVNMPDYDENEALYPTLTKEQIQQNVQEVFGTTFDPNQDWLSTSHKTISITANADLNDIVKIQVLTESPFMNSDATILNEKKVAKGQTVEISFDAPVDCESFVAACISNEGKYYIQVFSPNDSKVSFTSSKATTRASNEDWPDAEKIKLDANQSYPSFNAYRAQNAYNVWNSTSGAQWSDEYLWAPANENNIGSSTWKVEDNCVVRESEALSNEEEANLKEIINKFLYKYANGKTNGKKKNNLEIIRNSVYFSLSDNYLTSKGYPIYLTPIQLNSSEINANSVYYYYYDPSVYDKLPTKEAKNKFLKSLPKYKVMHAAHTRTVAQSKGKDYADYFKFHDYLLLYYGEHPSAGSQAVSTIIPKGYKIGFLNRKHLSGNNQNYKANNNGETYGDGDLNIEINHFDEGHFGSVMATSTYNIKNKWGWDMLEDDPRIAIFNANNKTYLAFEDGADVNFCDMIIEVNGGTEQIDETLEVYNTTYTFCFEDRQNGDYDMNDVIIKARRIDETHISYSVEACGAKDELYLRNINGETLNEHTEIHSLFGTTPGTFVNTGGGISAPPVQETFVVDKDFSFADIDKLPYLYNKTTNKEIYLSKRGEDPHGIIIPSDYLYPKERICIKDAYEEFVNWAENSNSSNRSWFRNYVEEYIYK